MPSCSGADFEVIERYLSLRDQIDSEDDSCNIALDQKLPQFSASFLGGSDHETSTSSSSSSSPTFTFPTMDASGDPWPMNFLLTGTEPLPSGIPVVPLNPPGPGPQQTTSYVFPGWGGTVTETSPRGVAVPFPEDHHPLSSPELYDLDKHTASFYDKETAGEFVGKAEIKTEQLEEFHNHHDDNNVLLCGGSLDRLGHPHQHPLHPDLEGEGMPPEDRDYLTTFMIQSLRDDIIRDCKELSISPDPRRWSERDTLAWVHSVLRRDSPDGGDPVGGLQALGVPGEVLCRMGLSEFQRCLPAYGGFLHQRLEIWRMAMDITTEPVPPPWYSFKQHPHHPHHHPNPASTTTTAAAATTNTSTNINNINSFAHGAPLVSEYRGGGRTTHMPPSISPTPSTDSTCSTLSQSSSASLSSLSLSGGGAGVAPPLHFASGYGPSHDCPEGELFAATAAAAATTRRKAPTTPAAHHRAPSSHPPPAHHTTPPAAPRGSRPGKQTIHLWEFLRELLDNADHYHDCIKWTDRARGVFKIEDSSRVARLWGRRKNRPAMNYDKLSRSVRQYYKKGIIRKTEQSKRLVYQFCQPYL